MTTNQQSKRTEINAMRQLIAGQHSELFFTDTALGVAVFRSVSGESVYLQGFSGKRTKSDFYYRFNGFEKAEAYRLAWLARLQKAAQDTLNRRAEKAVQRAGGHALVVGDVLVSSWGYDQTNYDYYQVTRLVGVQSVEIRELAKQVASTGWLQGNCVPLKNSFKGEPMVKRVNERGTVKVQDWGVWAHKNVPRIVGGVEIFEVDEYTAYA
jgi:hypothetical protein